MAARPKRTEVMRGPSLHAAQQSRDQHVPDRQQHPCTLLAARAASPPRAARATPTSSPPARPIAGAQRGSHDSPIAVPTRAPVASPVRSAQTPVPTRATLYSSRTSGTIQMASPGDHTEHREAHGGRNQSGPEHLVAQRA